MSFGSHFSPLAFSQVFTSASRMGHLSPVGNGKENHLQNGVFKGICYVSSRRVMIFLGKSDADGSVLPYEII